MPNVRRERDSDCGDVERDVGGNGRRKDEPGREILNVCLRVVFENTEPVVLNGSKGRLEDSINWGMGIIAQEDLQWLDVRRGVSTRAARAEVKYDEWRRRVEHTIVDDKVNGDDG
jgi:hypothetical protein